MQDWGAKGGCQTQFWHPFGNYWFWHPWHPLDPPVCQTAVVLWIIQNIIGGAFAQGFLLEDLLAVLVPFCWLPIGDAAKMYLHVAFRMWSHKQALSCLCVPVSLDSIHSCFIHLVIANGGRWRPDVTMTSWLMMDKEFVLWPQEDMVLESLTLATWIGFSLI